MKTVLISILVIGISQMIKAQIPKSGTYTYRIAFAEWQGTSLGATCIVVIKNDSITVINNGKANLSGKKGDIIDQGIIMQHRKSGKWIIGHSEKDKEAEEIGGCTDGPIEINFKRRRVLMC